MSNQKTEEIKTEEIKEKIKCYKHLRGTRLSKGKPKMNPEQLKKARREASQRYRERHMTDKTSEKYKQQLRYNRSYQQRIKSKTQK
jgi:hypothetical protein